MKLLTVTVPCYNSEAYMEKCVDKGNRYWTCHLGKEEQKELIYVE